MSLLFLLSFTSESCSRFGGPSHSSAALSFLARAPRSPSCRFWARSEGSRLTLVLKLLTSHWVTPVSVAADWAWGSRLCRCAAPHSLCPFQLEPKVKSVRNKFYLTFYQFAENDAERLKGAVVQNYNFKFYWTCGDIFINFKYFTFYTLFCRLPLKPVT